MEFFKFWPQNTTKLNSTKSGDGFTLVELIVVVAIIVLLTSLFSLNLASQRSARDLKIAQSQLVSNIRKTQSYTLSSRTLTGGVSVQYYAVKFDLSNAKANQYVIEAVYNVGSTPQYVQDMETIILPPNIRLAAVSSPVYPVSISRNVSPTTQNPQTSSDCALVAFAAPFGKVLFDDTPSACPGILPNGAYQILSNDNYNKLLTYVTNTPCDVNTQPPVCTVSTDSIMTITLTDSKNSISKTVTVNGITGSVTFN